MEFQFLRLGCPRKEIIVSNAAQPQTPNLVNCVSKYVAYVKMICQFLVQVQFISECTVLNLNLFGYRQKTNLARALQVNMLGAYTESYIYCIPTK